MPGARVRLIPDDLTGRAGEPAAGPRNQTDRTKWTDRIRGGRNRFKFLAKREVPGNAKQTDGKKNRPGRRGKSSNPADDRKAGINGKRPERDRGADQRTQCSPPEIAPHFRILMRFPAACAAYPVSPIAYGQNRDPVDVSYIERAEGDGSARSPARYAVVIPKRNSLGPEMVGAANDKHLDSSNRDNLHAAGILTRTDVGKKRIAFTTRRRPARYSGRDEPERQAKDTQPTLRVRR